MAIPKEPLDWLTLLQLQLDEVVDSVMRTGHGDRFGESDFVPPVDIYETSDAFAVEFEVPGYAVQDLALRLCCNILIVEGIKRDDSAEGLSYIRLERQFGRFCRTVEVPPTMDLTAVKARYRRGVLTVIFPRLSDRDKIIREIPIEQGDEI